LNLIQFNLNLIQVIIFYPEKDDGLIVMGDLPKERWWSHCNGRPTQMKDVGLIMMGDLPK
jgi:hypothetical protein